MLEDLDADAFEEWLCVYFQEVFRLPLPPQRNGVSGQPQNGVDLWFKLDGDQWVGVQAKAYVRTPLTAQALDHEIRAAHAFAPPLTKYIVCTTSRRNAALQRHAREAKLHNRHEVSIWALEDLAEGASQYPRALQNLYLRLPAVDQEAMQACWVPTSRAAVAVMSAEAATGMDAALRAVEDWIDAGDPARALAELERYVGSAPAGEIWRVRVRARFAQGDYTAVVIAARDQLGEACPHPVLLAYGAHAAQIQGDAATADAWLDRATALAVGPERAQVVGAYLRVHALRNETNFDVLESYVVTNLSALEPVALALADAAFQLGALDRAVHWYGVARARQAQWHPGAAGNALGAEIWQQIDAIERGAADKVRLSECAEALVRLLDDLRVQQVGLRNPMWTNLGHARRVLGDPTGAAAAWDQALRSPEIGEDLWVRRCILSANDRVPLPPDEVAAQWTTPRARIVLASACTMQGKWDRAESLLATAEADPTASREDRTLTRIERIRLEVRGDDSQVTPAHVGSMLALADSTYADVPLFAWLVDHLTAAGAEWADPLREAVQSAASHLDVDPMRRLALAEGMLAAGLDDIAHSWTQVIEGIALNAMGTVIHVYAASLLLRLYTNAYRFEDARRLATQLRTEASKNQVVALSCARALEEAGDRLGAYELLTHAINGGQRHGSLLLSWARASLVIKRQREANHILRDLTLSPQDAVDYAQLLQARALLGVHSPDGLDISDAAMITPATVGAVFGAGVHRRSRGAARVAYGRVVHLRIAQGGVVRFDDSVLLVRQQGVVLEGVQVLAADTCPWISDLIDARVGDQRILSAPPFVGAQATIVDVFDADRWSFLQALKLVQVLPPGTTGVRSVPADQAHLHQEVAEHANVTQQHRQRVLATASDGGASIAMTAAALAIPPRALLTKGDAWRPTGHPGTNEEIAQDDRALAECGRLVLDPVALLLLVSLGAEQILGALPAKPVMTPQSIQQLADWWYAFERIKRGTRAQAIMTSHGLAIIPVTAKRRRDILSFWKRVRQVIADHVEVIEPGPLASAQFIRTRELLGSAIVSGMALAQQRGWAYLTEEAFLRRVNQGLIGGRTISVHRLLIVGSQHGWWRETQAMRWTSSLIDRGWRWVSFPVSWLGRALDLPADTRQVVLPKLLRRMQKADVRIAIEAVFGLVRDIDRGHHPRADGRRVRDQIIASLPVHLSSADRAAVALAFGQQHPGKAHQQSRRAFKAWASKPATGVAHKESFSPEAPSAR